MDVEREVNSVISELHSGRGSSLYGALIMLRTTLIKSRDAVSHLVQSGAIKLLINLLEQRRRHVNQTKTTDIVLSILANLCLEEDVRDKVVACDGLAIIARVTMASEQESIQNRGVRALANLAQDEATCEKIVGLEVPAFVAKRLQDTEDAECRSTFCRALQLFGQTSKGVKRLLEDTQAVQALAAQLKLDNRKLALKSLRILSEFSALRCCPSFTGQILAASVLEELVTLADNEDSSAASYSLSIILRLCEQEIMRPALGSAGVITLFVKLMNSNRTFMSRVSTLNALCLCTKEAVNRNKIQEAGGLEILMSALKGYKKGNTTDGQFAVLYDRIISSLVNFLYNDDCLGKLLELGLVGILTEHLKRCCQFSCEDVDLKKDISALALAMEAGNQAETNKSLKMTTEMEMEPMDLTESNASDSEEVSDVKLTTFSSLQPDVDLLVSAEQEVETAKGDNGMTADHDSGLTSSATCKKNLDEMPSSGGEKVTRPMLEVDPLLIDPNSVTEHIESKSKHESSSGSIKASDQEVDPLIIDASIATDSDGMVVENAYQEEDPTVSKDLVDLPLPPSTSSRHTFSINSPTYQAETSWRMEDYVSGVTCKTFHHQEQVHPGASPPTHSHSLHTSPHTENLVLTPYSPLSAGASYYSPAQSSPSHSLALSPLRSLSPLSSSTSNQNSPAWSYASPDPVSPPYSGDSSSPAHSSSQGSHSPTYQNAFSPLSNTFPASPLHSFGERSSQSPVYISQASHFEHSSSQESSLPFFERPLDSPGNVGLSSQEFLNPPGSLSPRLSHIQLSQTTAGSGTPVYSASEDEEEDGSDANDESKVQPSKLENSNTTGNDLASQEVLVSSEQGIQFVATQNVRESSQSDKQSTQSETSPTKSAIVSQELLCSSKEVDVCLETESTYPSSPNKRCISGESTASPSSHSDSEQIDRDFRNSKRRKLHDNAVETVTEVCDSGTERSAIISNSRNNRVPSTGFTPTKSSNDLQSFSTPSHESTVPGSSVLPEDGFLTMNSDTNNAQCKAENNTSVLPKSDEISSTQSNTLVPPKSSEATSSQSGKTVTFQRMASYPGKGKMMTKQSPGFRRFLSSSMSPVSRHGLSPLASTSSFPSHGASPLISDSPYRSPFPETACSPKVNQEDTKGSSSAKTSEVVETSSHSHSQGKNSQRRPSTSQGKTSNERARNETSLGSSRPSNTRQEGDNTDARMKKILRTTEGNILILLARVSLKTNPSPFLAEAPVMNSMLSYINSAPNPIRRCCRTLNRLCSNPLCFEKMILLQMPALIVRSLILQEDRTLPSILLRKDGQGQSISDFLPSSQGSEASGSQASEFGRKMDFEFGGDAYSRMTKQSSLPGAIFRERPSLSVDSQSARDGVGRGDDVYDSDSSRSEVRVRIALGFIHTLGAVAMSKYGEGEIQHLLIRRSVQEKLACRVSLLYLPLGWGLFTRRQFLLKYSLWNQILPCLFVTDCPSAREAIVSALSLNLHLDTPPKQVAEVTKLPVRSNSCKSIDKDLDLQSQSHSSSSNDACDKKISLKPRLSLKKRDSGVTSEQCVKQSSSDCANICAEEDRNTNTCITSIDSDRVKCDAPGTGSCCYRNFACEHYGTFVVHDEDKTVHRFGVCKEILRQNSEVFAAMLSESYAESTKSEIVISDVSVKGFEIILHYLHGCGCACPVIDSLSLLLKSCQQNHDKVCVPEIVTENSEAEVLKTTQLEGEIVTIDVKLNTAADQLSETSHCNEAVFEMETDSEASKPNTESPTGIKKQTSSVEVDTSCLSPLLDFGESQDSLKSLTLEDNPRPQTSVQSSAVREIKFGNSQTPIHTKTSADAHTGHEGASEAGCSQQSNLDSKQKAKEELINRCADVLELADRFLLNDFVSYLESVLSYVCLVPHTAQEIFHLACFFKMDKLAMDCMREILLSNLPNGETAAMFVDLAQDGYGQQAQDIVTKVLKLAVTF